MKKLNRSSFYWESTKCLFYLYVMLLILHFLGRLAFVLYFSDKAIFQDYGSDIFYAFIMGLRYDLLVSSYLLLPIFMVNLIFSLYPIKKVLFLVKRLSAFWGFVAVFITAILIMSDLAYFSFFQDRLNILFFGVIEDDTKALATTIIKNYPVLLILTALIIFIIIIILALRKIYFKGDDTNRLVLLNSKLSYVILVFVSFILFGGAIRGGYNYYVIEPKYTDFSTNSFVNQLSINALVSFERAWRLRNSRSNPKHQIYKEMGFKNIQDAFSVYLSKEIHQVEDELLVLLKRKTPSKVSHAKNHVILVIAESFGSNWNKHNNNDFNFLGDLKDYFVSDVYFENFVSSHNGTIGSLLSVQTTIPDIKGQRYLSESQYMNMPLDSSINTAFKQNGYETSFVYGGKLAWRDVGKYFRVQGYDNIIGENAIKKELNLSSNSATEWGVFDEYLYDYVKKKIEKSDKPQFLLLLTTTNHPPFDYPKHYTAPNLIIPKSLKEKINREEDLFIKRFKAFRYANDSFYDFVTWVKSNKRESTVVAMTGDHNFFGFMNYDENESFSMYRVPFYLYARDLDSKKFNSQRLGSHIDIAATLYHLTLPDTDYISFGSNMLSDEMSIALNSDLKASINGIIYKNKNYVWDSMPYISPRNDMDLRELDQWYRSILSISDFYLKKSYDSSLNF